MTHNKLKIKCGILVAVPVPEAVISKAFEDCKKDGIKGNKTTPYLLKKINNINGGVSFHTIIKLVVNNDVKGVKICKELFELK